MSKDDGLCPKNTKINFSYLDLTSDADDNHKKKFGEKLDSFLVLDSRAN